MNVHPSATTLWILDRDQTHLAGLRQAVVGRFPSMTVETFDRPGAACDALSRAARGQSPWLLVTDHTGLAGSGDGGPSVRQVAHRSSPLTLVNLYSASAFQQPDLVPRLLQQHQVDAAVPKGQLSKLLDTISDWHGRWNLPVLARLREYMAAEQPQIPFATTAGGGEISFLDVHREIVLGTPQGEQWAKAWEMVFSDKPLTELFPELTL